MELSLNLMIYSIKTIEYSKLGNTSKDYQFMESDIIGKFCFNLFVLVKKVHLA